jgi:exodeoxyribonuclease V beta subunit
MSEPLDLAGPLPRGRLVVEASAGTGKTYSLSALVVRHVAERPLAASSLLVVTFTKAAAAELRDRTRHALVEAVAAIDARSAPASQPWMSVLFAGQSDAAVAERRRALADAVSSFDDATITTIHGFCQQALRQLGLRSGTALQSALTESSVEIVDEVCRDLVVAALITDVRALQWDAKNPTEPISVFNALVKAVNARLGNPGAVVVPDPLRVTPGGGDTTERLAAWVALVDRAVTMVGDRRRARQQLGFDDLVTGLRDAIHAPDSGPTVITSLNDRFQLVLIDEFQDTDAVQWDIFNSAFGSADLVTVGDPKQAIYRFRGADVYAYLDAIADAPRVHLGTNHRSDADLVTATDRLLAGIELGDARIVVPTIDAAPDAVTRALEPGAPIVIRRLARHAQLMKGNKVPVALARRAVVGDLVATTIDLLDHHTISGRRVEPSDIAVLVATHGTAEEVQYAYAGAGVPAVRTKTGSVLETDAYHQWRLLLAALEQPSRGAVVRAAGLGVFLDRSPSWLDPHHPDADLRLSEVQQSCARWASELTRLPFLAWYDTVRSESGLVSTLLSTPGGERVLTDIDHVAELLAGELAGGRATAPSALRILEQMKSHLDDDQDREGRMRRIDSDSSAVQITTLHSSKGLEYPIVLVPFAWCAPRGRSSVVFHHDGVRYVDVASTRGWKSPGDEPTVKDLSSGEAHGDQMRLLYVGLTRARHRTVIWCAPDNASSMSTVLFDRTPDGTPRPGRFPASASPAPKNDNDALTLLRVLQGDHPGLIEVSECPPEPVVSSWVPPAIDRPAALSLASADDRAVIDPAWKRWSFTAVTRSVHDAWSSDAHAVGPVVGGADESDSPDSPMGVGEGGLVTMPWAALRGGAAFGTLAHAVLESIDPQSTTVDDDLAAAVETELRRDRLDVDPAVVVAGLGAALRTPLGPITDGLRLADIGRADRLAELSFDFPLADTRTHIPAADIGAVMLATLPTDDPLHPYGQLLASGRFDIDIAGYLQGSIDAVLRVPHQHGHRYVVVDYKTNRLHGADDPAPIEAYHPDRLPAAMIASDYVLQSLLYNVALHRYLRWRLPGYDPQLHLGGIAYLYLRGMIGPDTPTADDGRPYGVFAWRPPVEVVVGLDRLFATGGLR